MDLMRENIIQLMVKMNIGLWGAITLLSFTLFAIWYTTLWEIGNGMRETRFEIVNELAQWLF